MLEPTPDILKAPFQAWVKQLLQGMGGKGSLRARYICVGAWGPSECAGSEERPQATLHGALAESQGASKRCQPHLLRAPEPPGTTKTYRSHNRHQSLAPGTPKPTDTQVRGRMMTRHASSLPNCQHPR